MDARNKHAKQYQSDRNGSTEQTRPDPLSALRVLREEGAVRNVNVGRMTAWWEIKLNTQGSRKTSSSFADVTLPSPATEGAQDILGHQPWSAADLATRDLLGLMPWSAADLATRDLLGLMPWSAADLATRDLLGLMDLVVEMAYPRCAIYRLGVWEEYQNEKVMSQLHSGKTYEQGRGEGLSSGSQADGLVLEDNWGHPNSDNDTMQLHGGRLAVYIPGSHTPRGAASLEYHPEGCAQGYCKLEVIELNSFKRGLLDSEGIPNEPVCVGGRYWVNTRQILQSISSSMNISIFGFQGGFSEYVSALVCSDPHPALQREFRQRFRKWPPISLIDFILQLPMLLVLVGHKLSTQYHHGARISWSHCELMIIKNLPESVRQGYIACKCVLKRYILALRVRLSFDECSRSHVSSYHIKTVFLYYLENKHPWTITSPFRLCMDLLHDLDHYLEVGKLPHYFFAQCNLLLTVDDEERRIARQAIQVILSDPLASLLYSPTDPWQIYGKVHPNALVSSFRRVITYPMCQQSRKDLSMLLARVDKCRHECYKRQRERDKHKKVEHRFFPMFGRPELTGLVEALKQI